VSGATIVLYSDSTAIGSAVASGTTTIVTTNGVTTLPDGSHSITATQTSPQQATSGSSPPLAITIETTPPVPAIVSVTPNPSTSPVSQMTITFSEPVSGLDLSDLQLTLNGGGNLLSGQSVSTSDGGVTWTLAGLSAVTSAPGSYELDLVPGGTPITDLAGNVDTTGASSTFTVTAAATVVSRLLFYNQSKYDGNDPSINASDDNAIASDKSAYLAGSGPATFSNISSYTRGINGIMVDITGSHPAITANDFTFQMGNNNSPANWASAPGPSNVTVRAGAGTGGSDRVELVWATGVTEQWLEVTVAANADTGLLTPDVFFFGSAIADDGIGDGTVAAITDPGDVLGARSHPAGSLSNIPVTNLYDYNRDGLVDPGDVLAARNNPTSTLSAAKFLNISSAPAAPSVIPLVAIASGQSTAATVSSTSGARAALASDAPANSSPLSVRNGRFDAALVSGLEIWSAATGLPSGAAAHDVSSLLDDELLSLLASGQRGQRRR
jgi:hypothetical protein